MELFENKVGRPSNEIIKKRRMFIVGVVLAIALVLFVGCYALIGKLQGVTYKSGTWHTDLSVYANKIKINGCKVTIPITVKNNKSALLIINTASIHYNGGKQLQNISVNKTLSAKTKVDIDLKFDMSKFKNVSVNNSSYKITLYNNFRTMGYYYDYDLFSSTKIRDAIKKCAKLPASATTKSTTRATNANGRPVATTKKTTAKTTGATTKNPAGTTKTTTIAAVKNGASKINHYSDSSDVWVTSDCKLAVQVDIENRTNSAVSITSAKLAKYADHGSTNYATVKVQKTIAAGKGKKGVVEYKFPLDKLPSGAAGVSIVTYFTNAGVKYWKAESINFSKSVSSKISSCKKTTAKPVAQPKLSTNLSCTVTNSTTGSGSVACSTVAGATVEALGKSPVSFMKHYTANSNGKVSFTLPQEGTYTIQAAKSGYTTTKYTVKVTKKKVLKIKDKVTLKNGYFYSSATATKSATKTKKSGTYYIWSATIKNNRIRITTKPEYAGKSGKATAWVNVSDLVY